MFTGPKAAMVGSSRKRVIGIVNVETSRLAVVSPEEGQRKLGMRTVNKDIAKDRNAWKFFSNPCNHKKQMLRKI